MNLRTLKVFGVRTASQKVSENNSVEISPDGFDGSPHHQNELNHVGNRNRNHWNRLDACYYRTKFLVW